MSVSELKGELKAGGVNTAGILEKEDLIAAITKLRWQGHRKRCHQEEAKLQRLGRQERTRQAEVAMAASLRGGNKLSEFWFPLKAGGKAMNTRQVRDYVWRAHEQERWSDVLDCAVAMEPMLASGEFGDAERHNILGEFAQAHSVDRNWEAAG
ncbi:hypothetical protein T484DRAFT_1912901, partial [Baffinella frigidus]